MTPEKGCDYRQRDDSYFARNTLRFHSCTEQGNIYSNSFNPNYIERCKNVPCRLLKNFFGPTDNNGLCQIVAKDPANICSASFSELKPLRGWS